MASFASSATTGGARKHAWTNFSSGWTNQTSTVPQLVCLFVCLSFGPDHPPLNHGKQFLIDLSGGTEIYYCPCYGWASPQVILLQGRRLDWHL